MSQEKLYGAFQAAVQQAKTVFITAHVGPDGDTLGSMLALKLAFEKGCPHIQRIDCVIAGKMPDVYTFMPAIDQVKNIETATDLLPQYDLALSVDCGSADRLGPAKEYFLGAKQCVNIDHHISNEQFGKLNIVEPEAGASGEVVVHLLDHMGIPLDRDIATCVYTAVVTDTGGFRFSNTSKEIFELAARLVAAGADPEKIFKRIYEFNPHAQAMLHADAVLQAEFNKDRTLAWTTTTRELLSQHKALDEHTDGIVDLLRHIDTVLIAAVFKESAEGTTKVSFRSDSHDIDVAAVAMKFQGGGHKMAAGCTIHQPPDEAKKTVLPLLEEAIRNHSETI